MFRQASSIKFNFRTTLAIIFLFHLGNAISQTILPANSALTGVLSKLGSPYYVKGDVFVPEDSVLIIEPGVEMVFDGKFQLSVFGSIKAIGRQSDTIRFYPLDINIRWKGIRFFGKNRVQDSAIFKYCKVSFCGPKLNNFDCAMILKNGHFLLENCVFNNHVSQIGVNSLLCDSVLSLNINACHFTRNSTVNSNPNITQEVYGVVAMTNGTISNCLLDFNIVKNPYNSNDDGTANGKGSGGTLYLSNYFKNKKANVKVNNCRFVNNNCGGVGAGISISYFTVGKILIKECDFTNNNSGRYGALTYVGSGNYESDPFNFKIDACDFVGNKASSSMFGPGDAAAIAILNYISVDSLIIKNCVFSKNTGYYTCVFRGQQYRNGFFLMNNVFKNNYAGCLDINFNAYLYSINNQYYNNLFMGVISTNNGTMDERFYSINDLYAYNGFKTDTVKLYKTWNLKNKDIIFANFTPALYVTGSKSPIFRNCIFWENRFLNGKLVHLEYSWRRFEEVSNSTFQGHVDSTVVISCDTCHYPFTYNIKSRNAIRYDDPLFLNPPTDFGPDVNTVSVDFRLMNTCTQLSPAYNAGMNNALSSMSNLYDCEGKPRVVCDTVDIGPYELQYQYHNIDILKQPKDTSYCGSNMSIELDVSCNANTVYTWQRFDDNVWVDLQSTNSNVFKSSSAKAGKYRAILAQQDCQLYDTSNTFEVIFKSLPTPYLGRDTSIERKASLLLDPGTYSSYSWQDNTKDSTYLVEGLAQGFGDEIYWVKVVSVDGCKGSDSIKVTVIMNNSFQTILKQDLDIYPNPVQHHLSINNIGDSDLALSVFNHLGQLITKFEVGANSSTTLNTENWSSGIYLIKDSSGGVYKVVK